MTIAIESGCNGNTGAAAWTSFRTTPAGVAAIVGEVTTSDNEATGARSDTMAVFMPDLKKHRAPQSALRARLPP